MNRVVLMVLRQVVLVGCGIVLAFGLPVARTGKQLLSSLTQEQTYLDLARQIGIGQLVEDINKKNLKFIESYIPISRGSKLEQDLGLVSSALNRAVDDAIIRVATQIPAYLAGEQEQLDAELNLADARSRLIRAAEENLPGARLFAAQITRAVETIIPERVSLGSPLRTLEAFCAPIRIIVLALSDRIRLLEIWIFICFALIVIFSLKLTIVLRSIGLSLVSAAIVGGILVGFGETLLKHTAFAAILGNSFTRLLISQLKHHLSTGCLWWIAWGGLTLGLSVGIPLIAKRVLRTPPNWLTKLL